MGDAGKKAGMKGKLCGMVADVRMTGGAGGRTFDYMLPCVILGVLVGGLRFDLFSGVEIRSQCSRVEFELYGFWNTAQLMLPT